MKEEAEANDTPNDVPRRTGKRAAAAEADPGSAPPKKAKRADGSGGGAAQARKLRAYAQFADRSPFPDFPHPTPAECARAHAILAALHGARPRPATVAAAPAARAGCGDAPAVLDALVRTILSQHTSDANSARAKRSMDRAYGRSDAWAAILAGGQPRLQRALACGGLAATKSRVIFGVLQQVHARYGAYSLDHLRDAAAADDDADDAAMRELLGFRGVGPKTASCVLLFCLGRARFAVDTHVYRLAGLLGWRPAAATRDETHQHLDARIPDADKYELHVLLVTHGRQCIECRAGGKRRGRCALRNAFAEMEDRREEASVEEEENQSR